jgi:lysophospholipase L1-like esterase
MKRFRDPKWFLILSFVMIIALVPLVQAFRELRQEEDIRAFGLFSQTPTAANLRSFERSLEDANWAAKATRSWVQFAHFKWFKEGGEKTVIGRDGWYFYKPGLNYMIARPPEGKALTTNDPVAAIIDFRDQLAARGIHLIVMPAPNKESVYPDKLTPRADSLRAIQAPRTKEVLAKLKAANVDVFDLFEEFRSARQTNASAFESALYLQQDTHWSPAGVSLAAKAVARHLKELGRIQQGNTVYNERPAPVQRLGDILRMMQAPQIERSIAPETVSAMQVIRAETNEPYIDEPNSDILILGDSFMRIYQTDQPRSAGFISHLARELNQPVLSLVNDGGGSTLVRQELADRAIAFLKNKKVVLWEFVERDIALGIQGWKLIALPPPPAILPNSPK